MKANKPYPTYKPSGVEWLGEIPEHWCVKRLKYCASLINQKVDGSESELPYTGLEHIESWTGKRIVSDSELTSDGQSSHYQRGDVLFGKLRPYLAKVLRANEEGICTGELLVLRPNLVLRDYLFNYILARDFISIVDSSTYGSKMPRANWEFIGNLPTIIPPKVEQHVIAEFLDRETERIDGLIEKKEQQIELLREKRSALISHAVTKGLNPTAKMKPSGVEWLGEVPEHWEVHRLKHVATTNFSSVNKHTLEGELPVRLCNYVDVYYNDSITSDIDFMNATATKEEIRRFTIEKGDVLITKDSEEWADIAVPAYVKEHFDNVLCGYHLAHIRPHSACMDGGYLFRAFAARGINDQFRVEATGVTRYGLGKYALENAIFLVPPLTEQQAIASFLDRETERIDGLIEKVQESIEKLREYRFAIISAAVTGKIDVRSGLKLVVENTRRQAPPEFKRAVLGAEIVHKLHKEPTFGRVKFEKIIYLCESHIGIDLDGNFQRQAAGPLDNRMLHSIESQIEKAKWYKPMKDGSRIQYVPLAKAGEHVKYFDRYWSDMRDQVNGIIELLRSLNTERVEIVATLFAAWNDLLLNGARFSDKDIIKEVRENWHESKDRFDEDRLQRALTWMREKGLIPTGKGRLTHVKGVK